MWQYLRRRSKSIKKLLVLDLDETLVHSDPDRHDYRSVKHINFETYRFKIDNIYFTSQVRPYIFDFLTNVSRYYDIAVFTSSKQCYADTILDAIDPENKWFTERYYYHNCTVLGDDGPAIKDLDILNRKLEHVVLVDDNITVYQEHIPNLIQIQEWTGHNQYDMELLDLSLILETVAFSKDVRKELNKSFY